MLPEKRTKTNVGVGMGVTLQLAGFFFFQPAHRVVILGLVLIVLSIPVFIWGYLNYAEGKGYSKWVGMAGLAGIVGLIVLVVLPDRDRQGSVARLQPRKLVGLICLVVGFGLVVFGRWLSSVWQEVEFDRLLDPWRAASTLLGAVLVGVSLILMLGTGAANQSLDQSRRSGGDRMES